MRTRQTPVNTTKIITKLIYVQNYNFTFIFISSFEALLLNRERPGHCPFRGKKGIRVVREGGVKCYKVAFVYRIGNLMLSKEVPTVTE